MNDQAPMKASCAAPSARALAAVVQRSTTGTRYQRASWGPFSMLDDNYRPVIKFYEARTVFAGAIIDGVKEAYFFFGAQVLELVGLNWTLCGQVRALQDSGVLTVARGSSIARANVYSMFSALVFPANQTIADAWYDALDKPTSSDPLFFARGGAAVPAGADGDGIELAIGCERPRGALVSAR